MLAATACCLDLKSLDCPDGSISLYDQEWLYQWEYRASGVSLGGPTVAGPVIGLARRDLVTYATGESFCNPFDQLSITDTNLDHKSPRIVPRDLRHTDRALPVNDTGHVRQIGAGRARHTQYFITLGLRGNQHLLRRRVQEKGGSAVLDGLRGNRKLCL